MIEETSFHDKQHKLSGATEQGRSRLSKEQFLEGYLCMRILPGPMAVFVRRSRWE
ncbi:MAG: hypothetical protein F6J87_30400 [Spirulina sp. SIO3F2]|nr:hypothetical protein [Spirulina sp. SIO3F2]